MNRERNLTLCEESWDAFSKGDMDQLVSFYTDEMVFVFPGQNDVLEGKANFKKALDNIGSILPPGIEITGITNCPGENEVVSVVQWKSDKVPAGSQCAIMFVFNEDGKITEERWFLDTEQWATAF